MPYASYAEPNTDPRSPAQRIADQEAANEAAIRAANAREIAALKEFYAKANAPPTPKVAPVVETKTVADVTTPAATTAPVARNSPTVSSLSSQAQKIFSGSNSMLLVIAVIAVIVGVMLK